MKRFFVHHSIALFAIISMVVLSLFMLAVARADSWSWTNGVPKTIYSDAVGPTDDWNNVCASKFQSIRDQRKIEGVEDQSRQFNTACLIGSGDNYQLFEGDDGKLAVSFAGESNAHLINSGATCFYGCVYMPSRDYLISIQSPSTFGDGKVVIFKDFVKRLHMQRIILPSLRVETYFTGEQSPDEILTDRFTTDDFRSTTKYLQRSQNDKWLVFELVGRGMYRMDMDTGHTTKFLYLPTRYWDPGSAPSMQMDITNDGRFVAIFGRNTSNAIYELTPDCGYTVPSDPTQITTLEKQGQLTTECPALFLATPMNDPANNTYMPNLVTAYQPKFSDDGGEITFYAAPSSGAIHHVALRAANYTGPETLDYLALGDSYSSGEGDIENRENGTSYYLPGTDYFGGCHISERSYPFLIKNHYHFSSPKMKSIACSGAVTLDIGGSEKYLGQGGRLSKYSAEERITKQTIAKDAFIPGYASQLEFIIKYKPASITMTIGGNDVKFGPILDECAHSFFTCSYADSNQLRGLLGQTIKQSYGQLLSLIELIHLHSPSTKIYYLGYPQFISDGTAYCGANAGLIDSNERHMIAEGVTYMNKVIRSVAEKTGVVYIDLEDSLDGGKLCESKGYVTGTSDIGFKTELFSSTFHPNAQGHQKIAQTLIKQLASVSPVDYPYPQTREVGTNEPQPTEYFTNSMLGYNKLVRAKKLISEPIIKRSNSTIVASQYELRPGSVANIKLYSDPIDLGTLSVDNDGGFTKDIVIPEIVPAGIHTLVVSGESYSGKPIDLYQIIEVRGTNPSDHDEDGISDAADACAYITPPNSGIAFSAVEDICGPKIEVNPTSRQNVATVNKLSDSRDKGERNILLNSNSLVILLVPAITIIMFVLYIIKRELYK